MLESIPFGPFSFQMLYFFHVGFTLPSRLQLSGTSSLRSWTPSLLRSLFTEAGARSSLQPEEWCTPPSSWWALSIPSSTSSLSHYPDYFLGICRRVFLFIMIVVGYVVPSSGLFPHLTINSWIASALIFQALCPHANVQHCLCRRPPQG